MTQLEISLFLMLAVIALFCRALRRKWQFRGRSDRDIGQMERREMLVELAVLAAVTAVLFLRLLSYRS
jgi:hypothetical protein